MTSNRQRISSGSPFEASIGFSRAVRVGNHIAVSGTAPLSDAGTSAHPGDVYLQTKRCLEIVVRAVQSAGGTAEDIVRTRILLTDIKRWREAAKAHAELFHSIRPACTFVQVAAFIDPDWLVEVEADGLIPD